MFQQVQKMKSQQRQYKIEDICQKFPQMIKNNNLTKIQFKQNQSFINKLQKLPFATFNSTIKEKIENQNKSKFPQTKKHNRNQSNCIPLYNKQNKKFIANYYQKKSCQPIISNQKPVESKIHKRHISQAPNKKQIEFDFNAYKDKKLNIQPKLYENQITISPIITSNQKRSCSSSSTTTINTNINSQLKYFNQNTVKRNKVTEVSKQQPLLIKQRYVFTKPSKQGNKFSIQDLQCEEQVRIQQNLHWKFIQKKQREEKPDPYYLKRHKNITVKMRAILVDWVMQISTFHSAIRICDLFLSNCPSITMKSLQLIGLSCLIISSKFNQSYPRNINDLQISLNNVYSISDILQMQAVIVKVDKFQKVIKYKINTHSFVFWIDLYIQFWQKTKPHYYPSMLGKNQQSYILLREVYQYADLLTLDIQSLQYLPRIIIGSLFYLVIGKAIKYFKQEVIAREFNRSSKYIMDDSQYNYQFSRFISKFSLQLNQILPSIQYVSKCFRYNFQLTMPTILQEKGGKKQQTIFNQTYNKQYLQVFKAQNP